MIDKSKHAFLEEACEILLELESALLALNENRNDKELVGRAFRALHNSGDSDVGEVSTSGGCTEARSPTCSGGASRDTKFIVLSAESRRSGGGPILVVLWRESTALLFRR
jgi:hypothetical protein